MAEISSQKRLKRLSMQPGALLAHSKPPVSNPLSSTTSTPSPSSPSSRTICPDHTRRLHSRRTSSISYILSNNPSPVSPFVRSPLSGPIPEGEATPNSFPLQRSASLSTDATLTGIEDKSDDDSSSQATLSRPVETLTLAEKHAELLSFIAQKESKCLELREQLSSQEAELDALKRRWERIVRRAAAGLAPAAADTLTRQENDNKLPSSEAVNEMVGVIREGVSGIGRLLVGGGPMSPSPVAPSTPVRELAESSAPSSFKTPISRRHSQSLSTDSHHSSLSSIIFSPSPSASTGRTSFSSGASVTSECSDEADQAYSTQETESSSSSSTTLPSLNVASSHSVAPAGLSATQGQSKIQRVSQLKMNHDGRSASVDLSQRLSPKSTVSLTSPGSSWMPSKEVISRSSKRASLLFTDVSNASSNFFESLSTAFASPQERRPTAFPPDNAYFGGSQYDRLRSSKHFDNSSKPALERRLSSLLDDDDDDDGTKNENNSLIHGDELTATLRPSAGNAGVRGPLAPVMVPTKLMTPSKSQASPSPNISHSQSFDDDDDDTWNW